MTAGHRDSLSPVTAHGDRARRTGPAEGDVWADAERRDHAAFDRILEEERGTVQRGID